MPLNRIFKSSITRVSPSVTLATPDTSANALPKIKSSGKMAEFFIFGRKIVEVD